MEPRERVERLVGRMYQHHLKTTGGLPTGELKRSMEKKAQMVAHRAENKHKRGTGRWR